jgi:hypothetical protein
MEWGFGLLWDVPLIGGKFKDLTPEEMLMMKYRSKNKAPIKGLFVFITHVVV